MDMQKEQKTDSRKAVKPVMVWDLPTRLFHWILVTFVIISFVTSKIGGNAMPVHMFSGYAILTLLLFRLVWGWVGGHASLFSSFVRGPGAVIRYATGLFKKDSPRFLGHNPLGGWSVIALLATLMLQAVTGLFANDDILTEGPLYSWVSKPTSDWFTGVHEANQGVMVFLIALHILAVLFYLFYKGENLVGPMITGIKRWQAEKSVEQPSNGIWRALAVLGLAIFIVYLLVQ